MGLLFLGFLLGGEDDVEGVLVLGSLPLGGGGFLGSGFLAVLGEEDGGEGFLPEPGDPRLVAVCSLSVESVDLEDILLCLVGDPGCVEFP